MSGIVAIARKVSPIALTAGAGMLVLSFLMPWWGITVTQPDKSESPKLGDADFADKMKEIGERRKDAKRIMARNKRWYEDMSVDNHLKTELEDADEDAKTITVRLWGWNTGTGITSFILGLIILPLGIVHIFFVPYRRWSWIGSFVAAVMGLVLFILGLVFYFASPSRNAEGLWQGVGLSPGPFLVIFGSLLVLASGVFGGVVGLMEFIKSLKPEPRRRKRKKKSPPPQYDDDDFGGGEFDGGEFGGGESDGGEFDGADSDENDKDKKGKKKNESDQELDELDMDEI